MKIKTGKVFSIIMVVICLVAGCAYGYVSSRSFMTTAAQQAGLIASEAMATQIELGQVAVMSWNSLAVENIDVYDKQDQLIAHVAQAEVKLSPLAMVIQSPTEGLSEINIDGADVSILQREDGSWNYEDLISDSESSSQFNTKINISNSLLRSNYNGQDIVLENVNGTVDMTDYPALALEATCENQGAAAEVSATLDIEDMGAAGRQTFQLALKDVDLANYLKYVPEGTIPEDTIKDISGRLDSLTLIGERNGSELTYRGSAELSDGRFVLLEENQVEKVKALVNFNEKEAKLYTSAETQGQKATARGKIIYNGGSPILDILAESEGFEPKVILPDIDYEGPVKFAAHITGAADNPQVDGEVSVQQGSVQGVTFTDLTAKASYADSQLIINNSKMSIAGGTVEATGTFNAKDYDFLGNVKLHDLSALQLGELAQSFTDSLADAGLDTLGGTISGDVSVKGNANLPENIHVYGAVNGSSLAYKGLTINEMKSSFAKEGDKITIDYLSCILPGNPGNGSFGLDGTVVLGQTVDLSVYASEADLSLLSGLLPEVPLAGYLDIRATVRGPIDDPIVVGKYAARDGSIYHQPFDQLHGSAGGSLRGVKIDDFVMEQGDKTKWYVKGVMGFLGDMGINIQVDTVGARMEDIMQAVAPDQNLTGNVDNIITITGTLKNPHVVGYVHFYQGSYNGIFINGMDGDYFVEDNTIRLQDFHVFTPWLDVDFTGTIDEASNLDMQARVNEVDLSRYNRYLPIPLQGTAQFNGNLTGTIENPLFEGKLTAQDVSVNGEPVTGLGGTVRYEKRFVLMDDMAFSQEDGSYILNGAVNVDTKRIRGNLQLDRGNLHSLIAMAGLQDNGIKGRISGRTMFSGSLDEPNVRLFARVEDGALGSYAMDDVGVAATFENGTLLLHDFSGKEGTTGSFNAKGTIDFDGAINVHAECQNFDVGAITEALGAETPVGGTLDTTLDITGTCDVPKVIVPLSIKNLQVESTLVDSIDALLEVEDSVINIKQWSASKSLAGQVYSLKLDGRVPLAALTEEVPTEDNQFDLQLYLDNADLSLLPTLSEYVDWAMGPTDGRIRLQGTLARPYMTGSLTVQDGAFKIHGITSPMTDFNVRMLLTGNMLTLEQCTGKMGDGSLNATGFLQLADGSYSYNLDVVADKLGVQSSLYTGPFDATLNVQSDTIMVPEEGPTVVPKISGKMFLENVLISLPDSLPESSDGMPLAVLDYTVELGKNVRFLSSSLGDLRLAGGCYFGGLTHHPNTSGSIYVTKGSLSYLKTTFRVQEGSINFGQPDTLMPTIVLRAGTRISSTSVYLSLDGPITSMEFKLTSDPKMGEAEIIQLLTLRTNYYNQDQSDADRLTSMLSIGLQMTLLSEVETAMRNVLNLDLFSIERDTITPGNKFGLSSSSGSEKNSDNNAYEVYNITLGKNISDRAMVKYTQSMNTSDFSYGLDYDLSDTISMTYKRDQDNDYYAGIMARFSF